MPLILQATEQRGQRVHMEAYRTRQQTAALNVRLRSALQCMRLPVIKSY